MFGHFSEESLNQFKEEYAERGGKPCGASHIASSKTCKIGKGGEGGTSEGKEDKTAARKSKRTDMVAQRNEVARLKKEREAAAAGGDPKKAKEARRAHIDAKNKLKELVKEHETLRAESGDLRRFGAEMNRYKATDKELQGALDSGKLSARTAEKVRVELAQRKASSTD
jgi:hypothetical protein